MIFYAFSLMIISFIIYNALIDLLKQRSLFYKGTGKIFCKIFLYLFPFISSKIILDLFSSSTRWSCQFSKPKGIFFPWFLFYSRNRWICLKSKWGYFFILSCIDPLKSHILERTSVNSGITTIFFTWSLFDSIIIWAVWRVRYKGETNKISIHLVLFLIFKDY